MKIAISAASGNIGRRAAERVIAAGAEAVLFARHPENLSLLAERGAVIARVSSDDTAGIVSGSKGAHALLWTTPPKLDAPSLRDWYTDCAAAAMTAVRENRIARVVHVSSLGAGSAGPAAGTLSYVAEVERLFDDAIAHVMHLRPGYFMENLLGQVASIRRGVVAFPYAPEHPVPFISTDDIGDEAAAWLLDRRWNGCHTRDLVGPARVTLPRAVEILALALGVPLRYEQQSIASLEAVLAAYGATPGAAREIGALFRALADPMGPYAVPEAAETSMPTSLADFAKSKLLPLLGTTPLSSSA